MAPSPSLVVGTDKDAEGSIQSKAPNGVLGHKAAKAAAGVVAEQDRRNRWVARFTNHRLDDLLSNTQPSKRRFVNENGPFHAKEHRIDAVPWEDFGRSGDL